MLLNICHLNREFELLWLTQVLFFLHFKSCFYLLRSVKFCLYYLLGQRTDRKYKSEKQRWYVRATEVQIQ